MLARPMEKRIHNTILLMSLFVTLAVTPWMNLDPINPPKFVILAVCAGIVCGNLLSEITKIFRSDAKSILIAASLFITALFSTFFFSGAPKVGQLYGTFGRNTGLLAYLALALILIGSATSANRHFASRLLWILIASGFLNCGYGLAQWAGIDPVDWNNPYNPILGTLGNPNFVSALLGISAVAATAFLLDSQRKILFRLILLIFVALSLFVIQKSDASQGYLIFAFGLAIITYYRSIKTFKFIGLRYLYLGIFGFVGIASVFGLSQKGPLANFLYQESVTYRGDYWRAGWKMTTSHPIFGVGLDSYGEWYRTLRTQTAALRRGPDVTSNSAHNVFLDISSNGGFILLIAYLVILGLTLRSVFKITKRSGNYDPIAIGLFASWLAYLLQSIISINQLGLAIWGWVLSGTIIGLDLFENRNEEVLPKKTKGNRPHQVSATAVVTGAIGFAASILISIWPMRQDIAYANAMKSRSIENIEIAANQFPASNYYRVNAAQILLNNKLEDKALVMARKAIAENPRDFNAWRSLISLPNLDSGERDAAIQTMKELDPFNTTIGK